MRIVLIIIFILPYLWMFSQNREPEEYFWIDIVEKIYNNSDNNDIEADKVIDELKDILLSPVNINKTEYKDLEKLLFLNSSQINSILKYRDRYGEFQTIYELYYIPKITEDIVNAIIPFIYIGNSPSVVKNFKKRTKQEILYRSAFTIQNKEGYNKSNGYKGDKLQHLFKYSITKKNILGGITLEKDPGERYIDKTVDFCSAHLQINDYKNFNKIIIGDYKMTIGQGVVISQSFGGGKSPAVLNLMRINSDINKTSSANEYNFFRGATFKYRYKDFLFTPFYSNRLRDATISDSKASFYTTGLHRTITEIGKYKTLREIDWGGRVSFDKNRVRIGLNSLFYKFNYHIQPYNKVYNAPDFNSNRGSNISFDYKYFGKRVSVFGEIATHNFKNNAFINGAVIDASAEVSAILLHRKYDKSYFSPYSNSFNESDISNEEGFYLGLELYPLNNLKISSYYDIYKHPWLKHNTKGSSYGREFFGKVEYSGLDDLKVYFHFKTESKPKLISIKSKKLEKLYTKQNSRINLRYIVNENIHLDSRCEYTNYTINSLRETGLLLYQGIKISVKNIPFSFSARYTYFDTSGFNTAIYAYEPDVLYSFTTPILSGKGSRISVVGKYKLSNKISIWLKFSNSNFYSVKYIGTGNERIYGNNKSDIKFQFRYKF